MRPPPGREVYPGEIFFVHSKLLQRSSKLSYILGGGSYTCFPVIETLSADVSAYITTNVISITDGQIFLSLDMFLSNLKPACDIGLSVTRVGSSAQWAGMRLVSGSYKLDLAQYRELTAFSQFSSDLGSDTKRRLKRGVVMMQALKQSCGNPLPLYKQLSTLSVTNQCLIESIDLFLIFILLNNIRSLPTTLVVAFPIRLYPCVLYFLQLYRSDIGHFKYLLIL